MKTLPFGLGCVGVEQVAAASIDYKVAQNAASAGTVDIVVLPAGCVILKTLVNVTEAFNASSNALTVGTNEGADDLIGSADANEEVTGWYEKTPTAYKKTAAETTVKARYAQSGSPAASAGSAEVYVFFARVE